MVVLTDGCLSWHSGDVLLSTNPRLCRLCTDAGDKTRQQLRLCNSHVGGTAIVVNGENYVKNAAATTIKGLDSIHDRSALLYNLKACGKQKKLQKGIAIHEYVAEAGLLQKDLAVATAIVNMYAQCGAISKAQEVFDELPSRDTVSWTVLINGYARHGLCKDALTCYDKMLDEGLVPDVLIFSVILKACGRLQAKEKGEAIHAEVKKQGILRNNIVLGTALVDMYAKCGSLEKAQSVFDELQMRNVISWNALIGGYAQHGFGNEALNCYGKMLDEGLTPDKVTFTCVLKACRSIGAVDVGEKIHRQLTRRRLLENNVILSTALVDMYAKCGDMEKAQHVFDGLLERDVVVWNALIGGYAHHGNGDAALNYFQKMKEDGFSPTPLTFASVFKACGIIGSATKADEIHLEAKSLDLLENNIILSTALVDMYFKCGAVEKAEDLFEALHVRSTVSWNALITGYAHNGLLDEAMNGLGKMMNEGFQPDTVTFACVMKACSSKGFVQKCKRIHSLVLKNVLLEKDVVLGTALVDMYCILGVISEAQDVFDELPVRNVATWTTLITGYVHLGMSYEAFSCYEQMQDEGITPSASTFASLLKACGNVGSLQMGEEIHAEAHKQGLLENNVVVGTALVDMYAKCGAVGKAQDVFDRIATRNVVSWNALIGGYAQVEFGEQAFNCFQQMQTEGFCPDAVTFVCILKACGSMGSVEMAEKIHSDVKKQGLLGKNILLESALVDMYARCGMFEKAKDVFDEIIVKDVIVFNALISGYARTGQIDTVFVSFNKMLSEAIIPNEVTFVILLTACSYAGLLDEGQRYFDNMSSQYNLTPAIEHVTCMVDLFSRAGCFSRALVMFERVDPSDRAPLWTVLLSNSQKLANLELGQQAFEHLERLDRSYAAAYVCMSNIYATYEAQDEHKNIGIIRM